MAIVVFYRLKRLLDNVFLTIADDQSLEGCANALAGDVVQRSIDIGVHLDGGNASVLSALLVFLVAGEVSQHLSLDFVGTHLAVLDEQAGEVKRSVVVVPVPSLVTTEADVLQVATVREQALLGATGNQRVVPLVLQLTVEEHLGILTLEDGSVVVPLVVGQPVVSTVTLGVLAGHVLSIHEVRPAVAVHLQQATVLASHHGECVHTIDGCCSVSRKQRSKHVGVRSNGRVSTYPDGNGQCLRLGRVSEHILRQQAVAGTLASAVVAEEVAKGNNVQGLVIAIQDGFLSGKLSFAESLLILPRNALTANLILVG